LVTKKWLTKRFASEKTGAATIPARDPSLLPEVFDLRVP
jgi:hypothetical protein